LLFKAAVLPYRCSTVDMVSMVAEDTLYVAGTQVCLFHV